MKSTNANDGTLTLKVSFEVGSDLDMDNVLTQNRVSQAMPQMPQSVKNYGVTVKKSLAFPLLIVSLKSPQGHLRQQLPLELRDDQRQRRRSPGSPASARSTCTAAATTRCACGCVPDRIGRLGLTVPDIVNAITQQNQLTPGGPDRRSAGGQRHRVHLHRPHAGTAARPRRNSATSSCARRPDGSQVRLKDVARLELGHDALQRHRPPRRQAGRGDRHLSDSGQQRARRRGQDQGDARRSVDAVSARHGVPRLARYDAAGHRRASTKSSTRSSKRSCS